MLRRLASATVVGVLQSIALATVTVVVPNGQSTAEGNADCDYPFNVLATHPLVSSSRYQQLYSASEFAALHGPMLITQIAFRPDGTEGAPFTALLPHIQISLSTMPAKDFVNCGVGVNFRSIIPLSCIFAENLGTDNKVVFDGPLLLSSANNPPEGGPKHFDIVIPLQQPFAYDPSKGNLLLDIKDYMHVLTTFVDAQKGTFPTIFRVDADDVNSPVNGGGDEPYPIAAVTQFQFEVIPAGDVNGDGKVDCADLAIVRVSFGKKLSDPGFDSRADVNRDGVVDIRDLSFVAQKLPKNANCASTPGPDLISVKSLGQPENVLGFCTVKFGNVQTVIFSIENQGTASAADFTIEVRFLPGGAFPGASVLVPSRGGLLPGETRDFGPIAIPAGAFQPDVNFDIIISPVPGESNTGNNSAVGRCIG